MRRVDQPRQTPRVLLDVRAIGCSKVVSTLPAVNVETFEATPHPTLDAVRRQILVDP
jgi:hypothetical protein